MPAVADQERSTNPGASVGHRALLPRQRDLVARSGRGPAAGDRVDLEPQFGRGIVAGDRIGDKSDRDSRDIAPTLTVFSSSGERQFLIPFPSESHLRPKTRRSVKTPSPRADLDRHRFAQSDGSILGRDFQGLDSAGTIGGPEYRIGISRPWYSGIRGWSAR